MTYKDEMQILVSKNMSKQIKKSSFFGPGPMRQSFESKFPLIIEKFQGTNPSKQDHYFVNDHIYLHRSFDYTSGSTNGYYEYGALHIKEPEEYFEFFITGDKSRQEEHEAVIKTFLEGVK